MARCLLDKRSSETLHLLSLEEFTDIVNGCAPNAITRNSFVVLRIVSIARYLQLKTQELHEALQDAHKIIGLSKADKVLQRSANPTDKVGDQPAADNPGLTEQDAESTAQHQDALASAAVL